MYQKLMRKKVRIQCFEYLNCRFVDNRQADLHTNTTTNTNTNTNTIDAGMANCSLETTLAKPVNQNNFDAASTMNDSNYPFIINQPFSIHYTPPVSVQAVEPQYYFYVPTQLNLSENQYLLINTMNPIPSLSTNMQVSNSYALVETMTVHTTNVFTDMRIPFEQYNIFVNDTL